MIGSAAPYGVTLASVAYEVLDVDVPPPEGQPFDEAAIAVSLGWLAAPTTRVTWRVPGDWTTEGLVEAGPRPGDLGPTRRLVDASERWHAVSVRSSSA